MVFSTRVVFLCCLVFSSSVLIAQTPGSLRGQVLDPSGAVVPKAAVTVTGPGDKVKVAETGNDGTYSIAGLVPGKYVVRISAAGFTLLEKTDIDLPGGRALTLDAKLTVATGNQEVTVADTQKVELDPSKNAGALVLKEGDLDVLSDDPDDLQADLLALAGPAAGPSGGQIFIDGFSNGQLPPKESIREIRINSNPFSTEFDTPGRGRIEVFTKPGSDKFHGTANINYSDWLFNARNPYGSNKPFSDTKNLQANVGGPLTKKASFFLEFNRRQQREAALINAQILDPATFLPVQEAYGIVAPNARTSFSPRIDYQLTANITLQGRYNYNKFESDNNGIGGTNLPNTASTNHGTNQNVQLTETWVVNTKTINETHFQYSRQRNNSAGVDPELSISVNGAFTSGSNFPLQYTNNDSYELQNYTSITHGAQFLKFGARIRGVDNNSYSTSNFKGRFNFNSILAYSAMQQGIAQGSPLSQIIANGGGPSQYTVAAGQPLIGANQVDAGLFFQDDWRVRPSITLSLGLRYEVQNNIGDKGDWAPRIGLAWGLGGGQGRLRQPKTVLRAGAGYFYDRFGVGSTLNALRFNGLNQVSYTVKDPQFYPAAGVPIPALNQLPTVASATYHVDSNLVAPTMLQTAIGIDRQLPRNITFSFNYVFSRGLHQLRTVNINTPLPGTYSGFGTGVYPLGAAAGIFNLYESSGNYRQNQLTFNANARINSRITLFGFYAYSRVNTDVDGAPSNPYNFAADWGRAAYDQHHRMNLNGNVVVPFGLRLNPNINYGSAAPFNITDGSDLNGDTIYNDRPAFAPPNVVTQCPVCIVKSTTYGNFVLNPQPGMTIIPVNYGNAFGNLSVNMRVSRTWGFGEKVTTPRNRRPDGGGEGGQRGPGGFDGGPRGSGGGGRGGQGGGDFRGGGGLFGGDTSNSKYTVTAGLFFNNLLNHVNPGAPEGNLLSPRFGQSLGLGGGGFGNDFHGGQSFNRRVEMVLRLSF